MRLVARFPDARQASFLIDTLRKGGFTRRDIIVSDLAEDREWGSFEEAADELAFIKTEREGLGEIDTFASGIKGLTAKEGIIVAVEVPKHDSVRVREMMEQSGANEIIQD